MLLTCCSQGLLLALLLRETVEVVLALGAPCEPRLFRGGPVDTFREVVLAAAGVCAFSVVAAFFFVVVAAFFFAAVVVVVVVWLSWS